MKSHTTHRFRKAFDKLPKAIQQKAREAYRLWQYDPYHKSLKFKQVHETKPVFSVRIGRDWRAVGIMEENNIAWFWTGPHEAYNKLIMQL